MAQVYLRDDNGTVYTDIDLKMIVTYKHIPDFAKQTLIQDEIPYSGQKVTYGRKRENRTITLSAVFDVENYTELNTKLEILNRIFAGTFDIGLIDEGFEYECNLVGEIEQENIKRQIKQYTFTFETTTPDRFAIT